MSSEEHCLRSDSFTEPSGRKKKVSVSIQDPPVSDLRGYQVIKEEEKHGPLYNAIPSMPMPMAAICCVLNILLPGIGTLISSFTVFCCGSTRIQKTVHAFLLNLLSAFLQMLTFLIIVGWIWSIIWGMTFVQLASSSSRKVPPHVPYYVRRQSSVDGSHASHGST